MAEILIQLMLKIITTKDAVALSARELNTEYIELIPPFYLAPRAGWSWHNPLKRLTDAESQLHHRKP
jgi:hypothetical protein